MLLSRMDHTVTFNVRGNLFDAIRNLLSFHSRSFHMYRDHKGRIRVQVREAILLARSSSQSCNLLILMLLHVLYIETFSPTMVLSAVFTCCSNVWPKAEKKSRRAAKMILLAELFF